MNNILKNKDINNPYYPTLNKNLIIEASDFMSYRK